MDEFTDIAIVDDDARIHQSLDLLVDDIVTTGGSIQQAYHQVNGTGSTVVAASTLVDRGEVAGRFFESIGVPYVPVFTYRDLDIDPVGVGSNQPNLGE